MQRLPEAEKSPASARLTIGLNEETFAWLGLAVLIVGAALWTSRGPRTEQTDFTMTYVGAFLVRTGKGARLYNVQDQKELRDSLFKHPNPLLYEHPPFEALLFAPLSALPFRTAYVLWALINGGVWLFLPYYLRSHVQVPRDLLAYLALWALFAPLGVALFQGQPSIILLLIFAATFVAWKRDQWFRAGMYLGLGLFRFQFVLPFLLIFALRRKWRFVGGFFASATLAVGLSLLTVGWHGILDYVGLLTSISHNPANLSYGAATDMPTLQGFVYAILGQRMSPTSILLIVAILSLALISLTAWQWNNLDLHGPSEIMFAAGIVVSLITGFHMFTHDFSPLLLALFLVAAHFPAPPGRVLRIVLSTVMAFFWLPPLYFVLVAWHGMYLMFVLLFVFASATLYLARDRQARATPDARTTPNALVS